MALSFWYKLYDTILRRGIALASHPLSSIPSMKDRQQHQKAHSCQPLERMAVEEYDPVIGDVAFTISTPDSDSEASDESADEKGQEQVFYTGSQHPRFTSTTLAVSQSPFVAASTHPRR